MIDLFTPPLASDTDPTGFIGSANGVVAASEPWELWEPDCLAAEDQSFYSLGYYTVCENRSPNLSLPSSPCDLSQKQS